MFRLQHPVHATFLVASVWGVMGNEFDPLMKSFTEARYDWDMLRARSKGVTLIPGGGHLNARAGYTEFPLLRDMIEEVAR